MGSPGAQSVATSELPSDSHLGEQYTVVMYSVVYYDIHRVLQVFCVAMLQLASYPGHVKFTVYNADCYMNHQSIGSSDFKTAQRCPIGSITLHCRLPADKLKLDITSGSFRGGGTRPPLETIMLPN